MKIVYPIFFQIKQNKRNSISVAQLSMRTISSLESMHSMLNRSLAQKKHFFKFIECLRLHESRKADNFFALVNGLQATRFQRHPKIQRRDEKIKSFTDSLTSSKINIEQFLQGMADDCESFTICRNLQYSLINPFFHFSIFFFSSRYKRIR